MQIKVEHTKTHLSNNLDSMHKLVTDAKLVLVGLNTVQYGQLWLEGRNIFEAREKRLGDRTRISSRARL